MQKSIYIITGGPGFGKTKLIEELRRLGYCCSGEFARNFIEQQLLTDGAVLPWRNPKLFQQEILRQRSSFFESVPENVVAFADRGIPDQLAFARHKGFGTPEVLLKSAETYRYARLVFVTPPWPEIFTNDSIRTETYEEAVKIHQSVLDTYAELNYELIELPLIALNKRCDFILQTIKARTNEHEST